MARELVQVLLAGLPGDLLPGTVTCAPRIAAALLDIQLQRTRRDRHRTDLYPRPRDALLLQPFQQAQQAFFIFHMKFPDAYLR